MVGESDSSFFKSLLSNVDLVVRYATTSEDVHLQNTEVEGVTVLEAVTR
jgi:hypothetical protein